MKKLISLVVIILLLINSQPAISSVISDLGGFIFTVISFPIQALTGSVNAPFFRKQNPFIEKDWHKEERLEQLVNERLSQYRKQHPQSQPPQNPTINSDKYAEILSSKLNKFIQTDKDIEIARLNMELINKNQEIEDLKRQNTPDSEKQKNYNNNYAVRLKYNRGIGLSDIYDGIKKYWTQIGIAAVFMVIRIGVIISQGQFIALNITQLFLLLSCACLCASHFYELGLGDGHLEGERAMEEFLFRDMEIQDPQAAREAHIRNHNEFRNHRF